MAESKVITSLKDLKNVQTGEYSIYRSAEDANGIYTTIEWKRQDGTLYKKSALTGGTSPNYTTRTVTFYQKDGTTVSQTKSYTLTYDTSGELISEVLS